MNMHVEMHRGLVIRVFVAFVTICGLGYLLTHRQRRRYAVMGKYASDDGRLDSELDELIDPDIASEDF